MCRSKKKPDNRKPLSSDGKQTSLWLLFRLYYAMLLQHRLTTPRAMINLFQNSLVISLSCTTQIAPPPTQRSPSQIPCLSSMFPLRLEICKLFKLNILICWNKSSHKQLHQISLYCRYMALQTQWTISWKGPWFHFQLSSTYMQGCKVKCFQTLQNWFSYDNLKNKIWRDDFLYYKHVFGPQMHQKEQIKVTNRYSKPKTAVKNTSSKSLPTWFHCHGARKLFLDSYCKVNSMLLCEYVNWVS